MTMDGRTDGRATECVAALRVAATHSHTGRGNTMYVSSASLLLAQNELGKNEWNRNRKSESLRLVQCCGAHDVYYL